ncbi:MAG: 50S ribosomal protein L11 [Promethearchaeota archaeon]
MAKKLTIEALIDGGKASGGPPIGPAIGPTGIPIKMVLSEINKKTAEFEGIKVPVLIIIDPSDKTFEIKVKTPMTSALLFKEGGIEKGSGEPNTVKVTDMELEQICKIARMKRDDISAITFANVVRTVLGTAQSCGITVDGQAAKEISDKIKMGEIKVKE